MEANRAFGVIKNLNRDTRFRKKVRKKFKKAGLSESEKEGENGGRLFKRNPLKGKGNKRLNSLRSEFEIITGGVPVHRWWLKE